MKPGFPVRFLLGVLGTAVLFALPARAQVNMFWRNSGGGSFQDVANWSLFAGQTLPAAGTLLDPIEPGLPGSALRAVFTIVPNGTVTFTGSATTAEAQVLMGNVAFSLGGFTWDTGATFDILAPFENDNESLHVTATVTGGTINTSSLLVGAGDNTNVGTLTLNAATLTAPSFTIAQNGTGTLNLTNGSAVFTTPASTTGVLIGNQAGSNGTVNVGGGSTWTIGSNGTLSVGGFASGASGTLSISSGTVSGNAMTVANTSSVHGYVFVNGGSSQLTMTGGINVAPGGIGTMSLTNGGKVMSSLGSSSYVGNTSGGSGGVSIDGTGSAWTVGNLSVGSNGGSGLVTVSNGGLLDAKNTLTVQNSGGHVDVQSGGTLSAAALLVQFGGAASLSGTVTAGVVTVDGNGSVIRQTGTGVTLDNGSGLGTLAITNGGSYFGAPRLGLGTGASLGVATISGTGSTWAIGDNYTIGAGGGLGTATVSQGGGVSSGDLFVGRSSSGLVTISNNGSQWMSSGAAYIGGDQSGPAGGGITGRLGVQTGGAANITGQLKVWAGGTVTVSGGTLSAANIHVAGGTLTVSPGSTINSGTLTISGGLLGGSGTLGGATILTGGTIAPSNGLGIPGALTISGNLTLAGGTYRWQLLSASGGGGASDYLNVGGSLAVTSTAGSPFTLRLVSLTGAGANGNVADFNPANSYSWPILGTAGGITGFNTATLALDTASFSNALNGGSFSLTQNNNFLNLNFTPAVITAPPGSYTWSSPFGGNWDDTESWQGQVVPPANGTADIFFTGGTSLGTTAFASLNLSSLNISGAFSYFNIYANNGATLTLQSGGLTYAPTTTGVQAQLFIPVILAANQTWTIATGGEFQLEGTLSGSANLTKTGGGVLEISSDNRPLPGAALPNGSGGTGQVNGISSTFYSGNITLLQGGLAVRSDGALGGGTLTIGPPTTDLTLTPYLETKDGDRTLANHVVLNGIFVLGENSDQLTLTGPVTLAADTTFVTNSSTLQVEGSLAETGGARKLTVDGFDTIVLSGSANTYTGGTLVHRGLLVFGQPGALPATGSLAADTNGYIGVVYVPGNFQNDFLARFNKAATSGTIGFDTNPDGGGSPNVFDDNFDLTGFGSGTRIGSATQAKINGTITPAGANYQFGGGGGHLEIASPLTGARGVSAITPAFSIPTSAAGFFSTASVNSAPPVIRLSSGGNNYTGVTTAKNTAVVFAAGALPATTVLNAGAAGYIGSEDAGFAGAGMTANAFLARFDATMHNSGTIGFDLAPDTGSHVITDDIDLSRFTFSPDPGLYLGSTTVATFSGNITPPATALAYRFASYQGGQVVVLSALSGPRAVVIGDPLNLATYGNFSGGSDFLKTPSVVALAGANTYAGGTVLYGGKLLVAGTAGQATSALGTGPLTVEPNVLSAIDEQGSAIFGAVTANLTVTNSVVLDSILRVGGDNDFTLAGVISGSAKLAKEDANTITLSAANTFTGGLYVGAGTVVLAHNNAAGTGPLVLADFSDNASGGGGNALGAASSGGTAFFTTSGPVIYDLSSDQSNGGGGNGSSAAGIFLASGSTLTINQGADGTYHGAFAGAGATIVKTGPGRLFLDGDNSKFGGGFTVGGGTLIAMSEGALGTGTLTVNGGKLATADNVTLTNSLNLVAGKLGGFGTFNPPGGGVTIGSGLAIVPGGGRADGTSGTQPGALSFGGNLTFAGGGAYRWQLSSASGLASGSNADYVNVGGTLSITATAGTPFTLALISLAADGSAGLVADFNPATPYNWIVLGTETGIAGFNPASFTLSTASFSNALNGGHFSLARINNFLSLSFSPAPIPGSFTWSSPFGGYWENTGNWRGGISPDTLGGADVFFTGGANLENWVSTPQNLHSLNIGGTFSFFDLFANDSNGTLSLQGGGLTFAPAGSGAKAEISLNVTLAADQTWNIASGTLEVSGDLSGSASLTKTGAGLLEISSYNLPMPQASLPHGGSTSPIIMPFTGSITLLEGGLRLANDGALGSGTLTIGPPTTDPALTPYLEASSGGRNSGGSGITLDNALVLNGLLATSRHSDDLTLTGNVTLAADTTFSPNDATLTISGDIGETDGARKLTVDGFAALILTGTNTHTGGTAVNRGLLVFVGDTSIPATGSLTAALNGYVGIAFDLDSFDGDFLGRFNKANTQGTIGLDTDPDAASTNVFTSSINLTGFGASARLGSATEARITGTITPQGTNYQFGGGGGFLEVASALTGARGVNVSSPAFPHPATFPTPDAFFAAASLTSTPLVVYLSSTGNNFTGNVTATNSAVIFGPGALPATAVLNAGTGGYIGTADPAFLGAPGSLTLGTTAINSFLARFDPAMTNGTIGFDSATRDSNGNPNFANVGGLGDTLNLALFTSATDPNLYLGSATNIGLWSAITLPAASTTYRFAGYSGGQINVFSTLTDGTGANSVVIGDPLNLASIGILGSVRSIGSDGTTLSVVILSGENTYTGGTTLYAGQLEVGGGNSDFPNTKALGTGPLTVSPNVITGLSSGDDEDAHVALGAVNNGITIPNAIVLNTDLTLNGAPFQHSFKISGVISGPGQLRKEDANTITLSAANTFAGGLFISAGAIVLANDTAAGVGTLAFGQGSATARFITAAPVITGLASDEDSSGVVSLAPGTTLTINQSADTTYSGTINGDTINAAAVPGSPGGASAILTGGALVKTGAGRLILEGNGTYGGGTTILGGALIAAQSHALGSGAVTLNGGKLAVASGVTLTNSLNLVAGKLGGNGTFDPPVRPVIGPNLILNPGGPNGGPNTLQFGNDNDGFNSGLTLASGGAFHVQMVSANGGTGAGWDYINVPGTLTLTATPGTPFTIRLISLGSDGASGPVGDFNSSTAYSWQILGAVGGITGFDSAAFTLDTSAFVNPLSGGIFSLAQAGNFLEVGFTPVPEPSTWALLVAGLGLVAVLTRRRR